MGYIEGEDRNQIILFPESIDEYVSDNNSVRISIPTPLQAWYAQN